MRKNLERDKEIAIAVLEGETLTRYKSPVIVKKYGLTTDRARQITFSLVQEACKVDDDCKALGYSSIRNMGLRELRRNKDVLIKGIRAIEGSDLGSRKRQRGKHSIPCDLLKGFLDIAIEAHRQGQRQAYKDGDEEKVLRDLHYIDAYQSVRKAMLGEEKPPGTEEELRDMGIVTDEGE